MIPGPGNYNDVEKFGKGGFTLQGKKQEKHNANPGPGSYNQ